MSIPSSRIRENLHALSAPENQPKTLPVIEPVGAIAARRGVAEFESSPSGGGGGGIASPLTEQAREYFEQEIVLSVDGVIAVAVRRPKKIVMTDANNENVVMEFTE